MSRPSQSEASDDELAVAEQQEGQRSEEVATQSPGGVRIKESPRWQSADRRRVVLETEPTKSNLARAHTLQGVAERLRQRVYTEAHQLARLQEEVDSATGDRALDAARLWYLEHSFLRRLRHHLQLVFREMHHLLEARDHFDADAVLKNAGGPALRLLEDLPSESSRPSSPAAPPALPAASTTSDHQPPGGIRECGDSDGWTAADVAALDQEVSEAEEACAEALTSSGDSCRAEVAVAMATVPRGGGRRPGGPERRFSPVQWSRDRFEKKRHKDNSGSSDDTSGSGSGSKGSPVNDSLTDSCAALQEASEAAPVDTLIADVDESEVRQSLEVFCDLQQQFQQLADTLRQHALIADGVLTKAEKRRLAGVAGEGVEVQEELPPPRQELLMHDVALVHSEMQRVQGCVRGSEASLRRIVSALPPAPTMVWLPPTPPLRTPRRSLGWFSTIMKKRFSRRK